MQPSSSTPDLASLVDAIERGDASAEAELFERFGPRVLYFARRELRAPDLADDVRSETFLRVLQAIRRGGLRSPDALPSFVLQTARHIVLETIRQRARAHEGVDPEALDRHAAAPPPEPVDPDVVDSVRETMHDLSPRDRKFLRLYYYEERPTGEIARELGIDHARVRLIKSRALQRFRRAYDRRARQP